jgi:hypothetical protein
MVRIRGQARDSGGNPIACRLTITLDAAITDTREQPHALILAEPTIYEFGDGAIDVDLVPSGVTTYRFRLEVASSSKIWYYAKDGSLYTGPVVEYLGKYYAGVDYTGQNAEVQGRDEISYTVRADFRAVVPAQVGEIQFTDLKPSGISTEAMDSSVRRIAAILSTDPVFRDEVIAAIQDATTVAATPYGESVGATVAAQLLNLEDNKLAASANLADLSDAIAALDNLTLAMVRTDGNNLGIGVSPPRATLHSIGSTIFGTPAAPALDDHLTESTASVWIDEVANRVAFKVRRADGAIANAYLNFE